MKYRFILTVLALVATMSSCRFFAQESFFADHFTPWHYVQQAPSGFSENDLHALDIPVDLHFTDTKTGDIVYVFRRHHTPYYQGAPDKQLAEVWRFDGKTHQAKGIYTYRTNLNF